MKFLFCYHRTTPKQGDAGAREPSTPPFRSIPTFSARSGDDHRFRQHHERRPWPEADMTRFHDFEPNVRKLYQRRKVESISPAFGVFRPARISVCRAVSAAPGEKRGGAEMPGEADGRRRFRRRSRRHWWARSWRSAEPPGQRARAPRDRRAACLGVGGGRLPRLDAGNASAHGQPLLPRSGADGRAEGTAPPVGAHLNRRSRPAGLPSWR